MRFHVDLGAGTIGIKDVGSLASIEEGNTGVSLEDVIAAATLQDVAFTGSCDIVFQSRETLGNVDVKAHI
ncbi:hypothetical protein FHX15_005532 [Rhizobium sp. BK650]|uniref:hypothetical protein n=1 Tax=Rhizobium sp. BK650 TaxID=2586990 RepID=UPI001613036C|nr:hypothetical protein [Rhizobium sp. BK650]MBB3660263.1 hypothetical protein [Rhizobium sp. BK650]